MANRLCRPSADLKGLWQLLLPDTPFPACGTPVDSDDSADKSAEPKMELRDDSRPRPAAARR
jgi:hypothetical protein